MAVATGRRKYFYGATRKEVQAQLRKAQQEQMEGRLLTAPSQTLESFLVFWLTVKKHTVGVSTYTAYANRSCRDTVPSI